MAASFKKTFVKSFPKIGEKVTTDTLYWKKLETPVTKKEYGAITHIDFSPVSPYQLAVTNSTRVQMYSSSSLQIKRTLTNFREVAHSGSFRDDGRLLVAGGDEGIVRLFDVEGASTLRMFKGHTGSVHVSKFLSSQTQIMSGGDDNVVRIWDIPTEKELLSYTEHKDYVRSGIASKISQDIVLTGSYDHTVKLYDTRIAESVISVDHGAPVESLLMFPTGAIFISAGGNTVKVWDALAGGKLVTTLCHHHKTVTCLGFCNDYQRLLSGGLDRHIKIYDVGSYNVVHTLDYPGAILSLGVSPDDSLLAVGTADGLLSLQRRKTEETPARKPKKPVSYKYSLRGKTYVPNKGDHVIDHTKKDKLQNYDKLLKKFNYSKALDAALTRKVRCSSPEVTISVIQELIRRGGIKAAVAGREGASLKFLIGFCTFNISDPRFTTTLIDLSNLILDIYSPLIGRSSALDTSLHRLREVVDREVTYLKQLYEVMGTLDALFSASQQSQTNTQAIGDQSHSAAVKNLLSHSQTSQLNSQVNGDQLHIAAVKQSSSLMT